MKIVVACGSIRTSERNTEAVHELAALPGGLEEFIARGREMVVGGLRLCNSEILAAAAMRGVISRGATPVYLSLKEQFTPMEKPVFATSADSVVDDELLRLDTLSLRPGAEERMAGLLEEAGGVVLTTPVYFGDRSSVANKLLQISSRLGLLQGKVFGVASVGAKRNGGQETCNIYSMLEALLQGALAVGNGPPTSQYGGTAVGGNKGHVLDDAWGLRSTHDTGAKVAHVAALRAAGQANYAEEPVTVALLNTMDTRDGFMRRTLDGLVRRLGALFPWVRFEVHHATDSTIYRCLGCAVCPKTPEGPDGPSRCAIQDPDDFLERMRASLSRCDALIVAGLNLHAQSEVVFRYQVLTERMRCIRRTNFELTDKLITGLCYHQFGATMNALHSTKTLTSYIRHNTTVHRSIEILEHEGRLLRDGLEDLAHFCRAAQLLKIGRRLVERPDSTYVAHGEVGGYSN